MFRYKHKLPPFARHLKVKSWKINGEEMIKKKSSSSEFIPHFSKVTISQNEQQMLRWMVQKDSLHQDMFLLGHPTESKRNLAFLYSFLTKSEIEYISVTKDTTEHDFKQRREILNGNAYYIDQSAVRAALHGRILIIDGIEKAEQNILPVINNLLENREMTLEDGRTLLSHKRYQELLLTHSRDQLELLKIFPVHPDFRVIAIGLPIPPYHGNTLDPPLRSRFQALHVVPQTIEHLLEFSWNLPEILLLKMVRLGTAINMMGSLPFLPFESLYNMLKIFEKFYPVIDEEMLSDLFASAYPLDQLNTAQSLLVPEVKKLIDSTIKDLSLPITKFKLGKCSWGDEEQEVKVSFVKENQRFEVGVKCWKPMSDPEVKLTEFQTKTLVSMIQTHSIDRDICLIGQKATGKTIICETFSTIFGYNLSLFPMYSEITTRDLFQKRTTDDKGNTKWTSSVLIEAMLKGDLCVLDGIDKISPDILLSLQTLIQNRSLFLFDGTRYVSKDAFEELLKEFTAEQLLEKRIFCIHPKFRLICVGNINQNSNWLNSEILTLFNVVFLNSLSFDQEYELLSKFSTDEKLLKSLIKFKEEYNRVHSSTKEITIRDLKRILIRKNKFPFESVLENLQKCSMSFLSKSQKDDFVKLCSKYDLNDYQPHNHVQITIKHDVVAFDDLFVNLSEPKNPALVPNPYFVSMKQHETLLKDLVQDHLLGHHSLLMGNQGVGKNKVVDYFLSILKLEREYLQLHRDTTVNSLTLQPNVVNGVLEFIDSPLVKAVKFGRILVLDEADKAPVEVVSIIKSLLEDGEMILTDHRKITRNVERDTDIQIHPNFRVVLLANRPGYPFQGNDFFRECGDIFSPHFLSNPETSNEVYLLSSIGPNVPKELIETLSSAFNDLRTLQEEGSLLYPYSTRELVNVIRHLEKYPDDGVIRALENVFDFDSFDSRTSETLRKVFAKYGIPLKSEFKDYKVKLVDSKEFKLANTQTFEFEIFHDIALEVHEATRKKLMIEKSFGVQTNDTDAVNHRLMEFNELKLSIPLKTPITHMVVIRDKIYTFNARTFKLTEYSKDYQKSSICDLYHSLRILYECQSIETSSFKDHMIFYGLQDKKILHIVFYDVVKEDHFYLRFKIKTLDGNLSILKEFSMSEDTIYVRSDHGLYQISFSTDQSFVKQIEIPNKGCSWISPDTMMIHQEKSTLLMKREDNKWIYTALGIPSVFASGKIKVKKSSVFLSRKSKEIIQHITLNQQDYTVCDVILPSSVPIPHSMFSADVSKQVLCFDKSILILDPILNIYRTLSLKDKAFSLFEEHNGSLICLTKTSIDIYQIDLHQLANQSKYWSKYIAISQDLPNFTIEFDKDFKEPNKPKHGEDDDEEHYGGNTFAGGTGGRDTAGLGGYGGPYRLDKGFHVKQVPDAIKQKVSQETREMAKKMAQEAYQKRLQQIDMTENDMNLYLKLRSNVSNQIGQLREIFSSLKAKEKERSWVKNLTNGEIDENKIIEGIIGEKLIYKKRDNIDQKMQKKPKLIHFLFDVSASMYRFNGQDQRLNREMEIGLLVMQSLKDFDNKYKYRIYGHSGEDSMVPFVVDQTPKNENEELKVLLKMHAHTQYCLSGDTTIQAIQRSVDMMTKEKNFDEKILFVFSDANLTRYGISGDDMKHVMLRNGEVSVYVIFIASFADEAEMLKEEIPSTHLCFDTNSLIQTFSEILKAHLV